LTKFRRVTRYAHAIAAAGVFCFEKQGKIPVIWHSKPFGYIGSLSMMGFADAELCGQLHQFPPVYGRAVSAWRSKGLNKQVAEQLADGSVDGQTPKQPGGNVIERQNKVRAPIMDGRF
jgi:hypothetical protein